ncbi:MAG: hypothetical protein ACLQKK_02410 [Rhodomicrobium sp.]
MTAPMQTLADFKRLAKPGALFLRRFPGMNVESRLVTVAHAQSNAVVFPTGEATAEEMARVAKNPARYGSWFQFPKASRCRFESGELIVIGLSGEPLIALKPAPPGDAAPSCDDP